MASILQSELQAALDDEVARRLIEAGWTRDVAYGITPGGIRLGAFRRPSGGDFWAISHYWCDNLSQHGDTLEVSGRVGVSYLPAYRLWPLLGDTERADLAIDFARLLDLPIDSLIVEVTGPADVSRAAKELVNPVLEHGFTWAQQFQSIEDLHAFNRTHPPRFGWEIEEVPTLLASAGRHDEARAALRTYLASGRDEVSTPRYERFSFRLMRWLDTGGVLPDPPTGPVEDRAARSNDHRTNSSNQLNVRSMREAVATVQRNSLGKNRDELKKMLTIELSRRNVSAPPSALEKALDDILASATRAGRMRVTASNLNRMGKRVAGIAGIIRQKELPATPKWLNPPPRASYPVRSKTREWVGAELDTGTDNWLDRVFNSAPSHILDTAYIDAWLVWDPEPHVTESQLAVHIGVERVGSLAGDAKKLYLADVDVAERRGELPFVKARLTRRTSPPLYVLELAAPLAGPIS